MAHSNNFSSTVFAAVKFHTLILFHSILVSLLLVIPHAKSLNFSFSSFNPNLPDIHYEEEAYCDEKGIELTRNQAVGSLAQSVGRASYNKAVRLWDKNTRELTSFSTHFSFEITQFKPNYYGDGFSFFLVPFNTFVPKNSSGGSLGLVSDDDKFNNITGKNKFVAVEFDVYHNYWDPADDHVGIDVNSILSVANVTWEGGLRNKSTGNAWVTYDSATHNLSVFLTYVNNSVFNGNSSLWYKIDLRNYLPDTVRVGFSAATGSNYELHTIFSWDFNSTLGETKVVELAPLATPLPPPKSKGKGSLVGGLVAGISVFSTFGLILVLGFMWRRRRSTLKNMDAGSDSDDFESNTGPKRFAYHELSHATNNFAEEGKLGEGGFGGVYLGFLMDSSIQIAVKRVSRGSKQGKKEFASEVKIISRLRHRNLVQLLGWCNELGDLLLVYEFMPNGSLDSHLYGGKKDALPWTVRYKIALGLASSLVYLHEEWEQCVVHRDIKSSNIMLDSNFNAKLGDFGLARLVNHELGSQTTVLAGTFGYLAPECAVTGKASKESDVYSFGVVALEIACGRRPIEIREEPTKVRLIEWVWDLYGKGLFLEATDGKLKGEFDVHQTECLMTVGLWCCHPDYTIRPSISQVIKVLKSEAPLPILPSTYPVPIYSSTPMSMRMDICSIPSSCENSGATTSSSSQSRSSSQLLVSGTAPLLSDKSNV